MLNAARLRNTSRRKAVSSERSTAPNGRWCIGKATGATIDRRMIGDGEHHRGALLAHQRGERCGLECAAAQHTMATEQPLIADLADCRTGRNIGYCIERIVSPLGCFLGRLYP